MPRTPIILTLAMAALVTLPACQAYGQTSTLGCQSPDSLVLVVSATENSFPTVQNDAPCLIRRAITDRKPITIIREDGAPATIQTSRIYPVNRGAEDNDVNKALNTLIPAVTGIRAQADGDDVMATMDLLSRNSSAGATVIWSGTGLADKGALDLTKPALITAEPAAVVQKLKDLKSIPDLSGRIIHWYGFGEARGTQQPLTPAQRKNYQEIYAAIFAAAGAQVEFHPGPTGTPKSNSGNGHTVTPVPPARQESVDFPPIGSVTFDDGSALGFQPGNTSFRDKPAAEREAEKMARWLDEHPSGTITVTGTTSSFGDEAGRMKTSLERAKAVCDLAIAAGAEPSRLSPEGVGMNFEGYIHDRLSSGELDETVAPANRSVILRFAS